MKDAVMDQGLHKITLFILHFFRSACISIKKAYDQDQI